MIFNSPLFFIFLAFVVGINYFLPKRFRLLFLVLASFVFIGSYNPKSLFTLLLSSLFSFYIAKKTAGSFSLYLTGIFANIIAIVLFNYFNITPFGLNFSFFYANFHVDSFIMALGLSFYSLQNITFLTEVYFKRMLAETSISKYILYSGFFPKIASGPVMLPKEFFPQIDNTTISKSHLIYGFQRILLGFFKKLVIADRLAPAVNSIFDHYTNYNGITTLLATYIFTIQLYFDFSGYTDIALGSAKMLGYDLKENFNRPLRSSSISEFWRRWHISLILWFTNYIYYPVVYKLRNYKKKAALAGILFTFLISAIWHGISLTFLAWAICHIFYLSYELLTKRVRINLSKKINPFFYKLFSVFTVFNLVCFSNIFFRAESMEKAFQLIHNIFSNFIPFDWLRDFIAPLAVGGHQMDEFNFFISIFITSVFLLFEKKIDHVAISEKFHSAFVVLFILLIMVFGIFNGGTRFIYMQF